MSADGTVETLEPPSVGRRTAAVLRRENREMIRPCVDADIPAIAAIINEAAQVYHGAIPADCWHEPYMPLDSLAADIAAGISFWGFEEAGTLLGVMGLQRVRDATLIRHAYVRLAHQGRGVGSALMEVLRHQAGQRLLV